MGKTAHEVFDPEFAKLHADKDGPLLSRPSSVQYEALTRTHSGRDRQMLYHKVSFVDQEGRVAGLIGTITDVTDYKRPSARWRRAKRDSAC